MNTIIKEAKKKLSKFKSKKEVDEYILTYKPIYQDKLQKRLVNSTEYQNASDKDREHIEDEFKYEVIDELPERAELVANATLVGTTAVVTCLAVCSTKAD